MSTASCLIDDCMPPSTPIRQEFYKRPHTPESGVDDHPNTKPFQGSSRLMASPKSSFLAARRARPTMDFSRPMYQRSPLKASVSSESLTLLQASTNDGLSSLSLEVPDNHGSSRNIEMMIPPATPLFQSSFSMPSLISSSTSSSASSVSSFEGCPRPSISSTLSSSSTYFTACDDDEALEEDDELCSPRNSGAWTYMPSLCMSSTSEVLVAVNHEGHGHQEQQQQHEEEQKQPEPKKKKTNPLWSALQGIKDSASAIASKSQSTSAAPTTEATKASSTSKVPSDIAASTSALSKVKKVPDFIFSPRSYTESRSFGDFYQAL
ncbi:hypothetical protein BGZ65_012184, partial [Modicella reniformis]